MKNFNLIFSSLTIGFIFIYYYSQILLNDRNKKQILLISILFLIVSPLLFLNFKDLSRFFLIYIFFILVIKTICRLKTSTILSYIFLLSIIYFISETIFIITSALVLNLNNKTTQLFLNDNCLTYITIFFISYAIYSFKFIQIYIKKTLFLIEKDKYCLIFSFLILFIIILFKRNYFIYGFSSEYIFNICLAFLFLIIFSYILMEKTKLQKISKEYDFLINCLEKYEKEIYKKRIVMHEFKNQIITIKGMVYKNNNKLNKYLNTIIEEIKYEDFSKILNIKILKDLGWQGLISYKLGAAESKKIEPIVNIKKETKQKIENELNSKQKRDLLKLIGIYLDNAIEAVEKTTKKLLEISIEIKKGEIELKISNSFSKKQKKTNENGRGYGLILAERLLKNNNFIKETTEVDKTYIKIINIKLKS